LILAFLGLGITGCSDKKVIITNERIPLVVFAAGSLIIPFEHLEKAFESRYANIDVQAEFHGSIQVMRHVTDLLEEIDVVATADATLIPMLMYSSINPDTGQSYANWYIRFASNRLALAYNDESLYKNEINTSNWAEILALPDVKLGLADPRFDASGYRTLMAIALEEIHADHYDLFEPIFDGQFSMPIVIFREDLTMINVPEILETVSGAHILLRGSSIQLISLLETGDLDYAFEYESVIRQHGLDFLSLPDGVNLGEEGFDEIYDLVQVNLDFQRFAKIKPEFSGERIGYGITIPSNAPHPQEAALFIAFLLSPEGRALMETDYHPIFNPVNADGFQNIPADLQSLCLPAQ